MTKMEDGNLKGRVALVTGASTGLGAHFAQILAANGADVAVTARRQDKLAALAASIEATAAGNAKPRRCAAFSMDVRNEDAIAHTLTEIEENLGPIDILINNAGIAIQKPAEACTGEDYDAVMDTNIRGSWLCAQQVGRRMIAREQGGKIVNIASLLAAKVVPQVALYAMSKAAVVQMTRALALEWARHNIQVNAISPGYIETDINAALWQTEAGQRFIKRFPRKRVGQPKDLDGALLMLASTQSDFMTGSVIAVDDGQALT